MIDALDDILKKIRLKSVFYFQTDFSAPWGMDISNGSNAQFHLITGGGCILKTDGMEITLGTRDIVMFPTSKSHSLCTTSNVKCTPGGEVVEKIWANDHPFQGEKTATSLICGHFEYDSNLSKAFDRSLPDMLLLRANEIKRKKWLNQIIELIVNETSSSLPGGEVLATRLGEALFIHLIRAYSELKGAHVGILKAIYDPQISTVLHLIHDSPENEWTLESIAHAAGMSRTSLANRFRDVMGETPINYLTEWRITLAKQMLRESDMQVKEIAYKIGYKSETAFIRVFRTRLNSTPLKYRASQLSTHI